MYAKLRWRRGAEPRPAETPEEKASASEEWRSPVLEEEKEKGGAGGGGRRSAV